MLLTVPELVWELTFGIYLIAKGFTSPATRQTGGARRPHPAEAVLVP